MGFVPTAVGTTGLVAGLLEIIVGVAVYPLRSPSRVNQYLAAMLVLEGISVAAGYGLFYMAQDYGDAWGFQGVGVVATFAAFMTAYPLFLGRALDTPLVRPFRRAPVAIALGLLTLFACLSFLFLGDSAIGPLYAPGEFGVEYLPWDTRPTPAALLWGIPVAAVLLFALVASVAALRRTARGSLARKRAKTFVAAFGLRDGFYLSTVVLLNPSTPQLKPFFYIATSVVVVVFVAILTYGILVAQLFDLPWRIRYTVRQGTVAGVFVAVFLVAAQLAEGFAQQLFGGAGWVVGAIAAGFLLFFLTPIQRLADRVAHAAVPNAQRIGAATLDERLAFFEEQVQIAWQDGKLSSKERELLEAQRTRLKIPAETALRLERRVAAGHRSSTQGG